MSAVHILPHPRVSVKSWDPITGYPVEIEVEMSDRTIQNYVHHIPQTPFVEAIKGIRNMKNPIVGYPAKHEKK